jgi:hypothetical protein
MDIQQATIEQIATFKQAAARRYAERGIDPKTANALFDRKLSGLASAMGLPLTVALPKREELAEKIASAVHQIRSRKQ